MSNDVHNTTNAKSIFVLSSREISCHGRISKATKAKKKKVTSHLCGSVWNLQFWHITNAASKEFCGDTFEQKEL